MLNARELSIKLREGRVQSKYIKPDSIFFCCILTQKISWKSKSVPSSQNPFWNESKVFPFQPSNSVRLELHQILNKQNPGLLGSVVVSMEDMLGNKKAWWDLHFDDKHIGALLIEVTFCISPKNSPLRCSQETLSFRIGTERIKARKNSEDIRNPGELQDLHEKGITEYIEKIKKEYCRIHDEKNQLKIFKQKIKAKEAMLLEEKNEVERQKKELGEELKAIQTLRVQLNKDYAELKYEKYKRKAQKVLLKTRQRRILGVSTQIFRQHRLVNKKLYPELSARPMVSHSCICLTESVKPITADSDSPPSDSPVNTQDSF